MKLKGVVDRKKMNENHVKEHVMFFTKYNRHVLQGKISIRLYEIIPQILDDIHCECHDLSINPNWVRLRFSRPNDLPSSKVMEKVKGISSRRLRKEFPTLKERTPKALWTPSVKHLKRHYASKDGTASDDSSTASLAIR